MRRRTSDNGHQAEVGGAASVRIVPRDDAPAVEWDAFVERHADGWWWHTSAWLDYQRVYRPNDRDESFAIVEADRIVGVVPLFVDVAGVARLDGDPAPLYAATIYSPGRVTLDHLHRIHVRRWLSCERPRPPGEPASTFSSRATRVVPLGLPVDQLWRAVRRSYHSLIHRAEERHKINVAEQIGTCRSLHLRAAGRATRSDETWRLMGEWIRDGRAVAMVAREATGEPTGYVYVYTWKQWAYYGSSAVLSVEGVGHALQWAMINALRSRTIVQNYEMGYLPADPTGKERTIQHFKRGFGGQDWIVRVNDVRIDE